MTDVLIKCYSHRARRKVAALLGYSTRHGDGLPEMQAYYSFKVSGNWHYAPSECVPELARIPGVTIVKRPPADLRKCWGYTPSTCASCGNAWGSCFCVRETPRD